MRWASGGRGGNRKWKWNDYLLGVGGCYKGEVGQEHWSVEDFRGAVSQSASVAGLALLGRCPDPIWLPATKKTRRQGVAQNAGDHRQRSAGGVGDGDRRVKVALLSFCLVGRVCCRSRPPFGVPVRKWLVSHSFFREGGSWGILFVLGLCKLDRSH